MAETYMLTIPDYPWIKKGLKAIIEHNDIHKWIIAKETGKGGYKHYQVRLTTNLSFEALKQHFREAHIEKASEDFRYERKEGRFWCSDDNSAILSTRYGQLSEIQKRIINQAKNTNNRSILVVYDANGGKGKSFLCRYLYERGTGFYCPPTIDTVKGLIQFIASGYTREEFIIIDIPRSWKWSEQLYTAIESIKDGLVYDTRYKSQIRDIYGVKVIVLSNTLPKLNKLSLDRWKIMDITDAPRYKKKRGSVAMPEDSPQPPPQSEV